MTAFDIHAQVGRVVAERPARSRVFDRYGIDYCCGGKVTVEEVCRNKGIDPATLIAELEAVDAKDSADGVDPLDMTMTELADHIELTHHAYLHEELPRLSALIDKVAAVHGAKYAWLENVRATFADLVAELVPHMMKEEQILFPMIRELDHAVAAPSFHCGSVKNPIRAMEQEHDGAGRALRLLRALTGDFMPPEGACNSFRAMLDGLTALETDMHQHIAKENNVLFVRAATMEEHLRDVAQ